MDEGTNRPAEEQAMRRNPKHRLRLDEAPPDEAAIGPEESAPGWQPAPEPDPVNTDGRGATTDRDRPEPKR